MTCDRACSRTGSQRGNAGHSHQPHSVAGCLTAVAMHHSKPVQANTGAPSGRSCAPARASRRGTRAWAAPAPALARLHEAAPPVCFSAQPAALAWGSPRVYGMGLSKTRRCCSPRRAAGRAAGSYRGPSAGRGRARTHVELAALHGDHLHGRVLQRGGAIAVQRLDRLVGRPPAPRAPTGQLSDAEQCDWAEYVSWHAQESYAAWRGRSAAGRAAPRWQGNGQQGSGQATATRSRASSDGVWHGRLRQRTAPPQHSAAQARQRPQAHLALISTTARSAPWYVSSTLSPTARSSRSVSSTTGSPNSRPLCAALCLSHTCFLRRCNPDTSEAQEPATAPRYHAITRPRRPSTGNSREMQPISAHCLMSGASSRRTIW